ncbi:PREDICTED: hybrid signal transduction histidine kinase B-like isoform X2 [Wasmannia auropunctata]|uniref:hybrid signal transduction histidine kinase B-like isoform X2 n=1 Tax=Wasmannia auropunctata TaxID=64793 RepID=UPI0005EE3C33|nr:PREDICTED: hybrid signal transduction histidine kinase B-like isoform X2 [Wasmannia auropunctata]
MSNWKNSSQQVGRTLLRAKVLMMIKFYIGITDLTKYCSQVKSFTHRDNRTDDRHNPNRRRRSPIRDNDEKDRGRNERRNKSSLHHNSRSVSFFRDQSRSRYRSRSLSLTNERAREKRVDNYKNRVSSRKNYSDASRELDANCASSFMDYNAYMRLSGPMPMPMPMPIPMPMPTPMSMPMFRGQAPPVLVPIFPRTFPTSFPPMNIYRWQRPPPRFVNSKGIRPNNRYNS